MKLECKSDSDSIYKLLTQRLELLKGIKAADHIHPYLDQVELMSDDETLVVGDAEWNPTFDVNTRQAAVAGTEWRSLELTKMLRLTDWLRSCNAAYDYEGILNVDRKRKGCDHRYRNIAAKKSNTMAPPGLPRSFYNTTFLDKLSEVQTGRLCIKEVAIKWPTPEDITGGKAKSFTPWEHAEACFVQGTFEYARQFSYTSPSLAEGSVSANA